MTPREDLEDLILYFQRRAFQRPDVYFGPHHEAKNVVTENEYWDNIYFRIQVGLRDIYRVKYGVNIDPIGAV